MCDHIQHRRCRSPPRPRYRRIRIPHDHPTRHMYPTTQFINRMVIKATASIRSHTFATCFAVVPPPRLPTSPICFPTEGSQRDQTHALRRTLTTIKGCFTRACDEIDLRRYLSRNSSFLQMTLDAIDCRRCVRSTEHSEVNQSCQQSQQAMLYAVDWIGLLTKATFGSSPQGTHR